MTENLEDVKFPFKTPEQLSQYLPYLITRLTNRWQVKQDADLKDIGVQGATMRILACLGAYKQLTVNELSVLSVTEQSTVSRLVEQLVTAGMAQREIDATDQRVRRVSLTAKGRKKLKETAPVINRNYHNMTDDIDPAQLAVCVEVMQAMLKKIRVHDL
tara:strand:+ start:3901 stop:4377 length:477 start_codon:yes stop_codon:yes gene_type:complete